MHYHKLVTAVAAAFIAISFSGCSSEHLNDYSPEADSLRFSGEAHLRNIRQLTFGGNNAEAYWSFDDKQFVFQSDWDKINPQGCDQIFVMNSDGSSLSGGEKYKMISTGKGRTTCSYFLKDGRIIYASTHGAGDDCPESQMFKSGKYVWPIFDTYDIYVVNPDGTDLHKLIGEDNCYDAEPTVSPDGKYIVYTSTRSGDLDLWRYDIATGENIQLTHEPGYDGGAFFSHDSKMIVWRASRFKGQAEADYKELLAQDLVEPTALNIYISDIDGKNVKQVTRLPGANWAPFFHPDDDKIIFCSNNHSLEYGGRLFDLFMVNLDGSNLEQITNSGTFDAFPVFSNDGEKLAFASNRNIGRMESRITNIFVADWVESPTDIDKNFKPVK